MIVTQCILLLSTVVLLTNATPKWTSGQSDHPICGNCSHNHMTGTCYVKSQQYCSVYYMCVRDPQSPDGFTWHTMCCAEGLTYDQEHLTCDRILESCDPSRAKCPNVTAANTTTAPCPYASVPSDAAKFAVSDNVIMECPSGTVWNQDNCTCDFGDGPLAAPCHKILNFSFTDSFDSYSCNTLADGDPYHEPSIDGGALCLNGVHEFVSIGFLNNWFAWNPRARTFSFCFWFRPNTDAATAGLFFIDFVAEFYLDGGELVAELANIVIPCGEYPSTSLFSKVCVTFDHGDYIVYYNGAAVKNLSVGDLHPNSHFAAFLGFMPEMPRFDGCIDDFCFWDTVLSGQDVLECYNDGPTNEL